MGAKLGIAYSTEEIEIFKNEVRRFLYQRTPPECYQEILTKVNQIRASQGKVLRTEMAVKQKYSVLRVQMKIKDKKLEKRITNGTNKPKTPEGAFDQLNAIIDLLRETISPIILENECLKQKLVKLEEIKRVVESYNS